MKYNEYIQSSWVERQIKRHGSDLCDGLISSLISNVLMTASVENQENLQNYDQTDLKPPINL